MQYEPQGNELTLSIAVLVRFEIDVLRCLVGLDLIVLDVMRLTKV